MMRDRITGYTKKPLAACAGVTCLSLLAAQIMSNLTCLPIMSIIPGVFIGKWRILTQTRIIEERTESPAHRERRTHDVTA